jgi:hypothetical protein
MVHQYKNKVATAGFPFTRINIAAESNLYRQVVYGLPGALFDDAAMHGQ